MVDSVNSTSANSALRAQQIASTQALNATRTPPTTITQKSAVAPTKSAASVTQTVKVVSANSNLPRGSIVDKLV